MDNNYALQACDVTKYCSALLAVDHINFGLPWGRELRLSGL